LSIAQMRQKPSCFGQRQSADDQQRDHHDGCWVRDGDMATTVSKTSPSAAVSHHFVHNTNQNDRSMLDRACQRPEETGHKERNGNHPALATRFAKQTLEA
jgi:hypothetical protein